MTIIQFILITIISLTKEDKTVFIFKHIRHGIRAPFFDDSNGKTYKDIFNINWEKSGILTGRGISFAFSSGIKDQHKYNTLIKEMTSNKQLRIKTTNTYNSKRTAKSFLEGMFSYLFIQNISRLYVDLFNEEEIGHLLLDKKYCPNFKRMREYNKRNIEIKNMYKKINDTFGKELLLLYNKDNYDFLFNFESVHHICDTLIIDYELYNNFTYYMKQYDINVELLYNMCIEFRNISLFNVEINETISNVAIQKTFPYIIQLMENVINNKSEHIKILIYSGHDIMIAPMEMYLKKIFGTPLIYPHYGSNLNLKLIQNENEFYVEYYFYDDLIYKTNFNNFKEKILKGLWTNEEISEFCNRDVKLTDFNFALFIFVVCFIIIISCAFSFFIYKYLKRKKINKRKIFIEKGNEGNELDFFNNIFFEI